MTPPYIVRVERRKQVRLPGGRPWDLRPGYSVVNGDDLPWRLPDGVYPVAEAELPAGLRGLVARAKDQARRVGRPVPLG